MEIQPLTHAAFANALAPAISSTRQTTTPSADPALAPKESRPTPELTREAENGDLDAIASTATRKELESAIEEIEKVVQPVAQALKFSIDDETRKTVVKVIDSGTNEVIRQIPSEELLSIARALDKLQGLLVKQKA